MSITSVLPVGDWKAFWTRVKGGLSTAWNWIKDKAIPIAKNVIAPCLPG